MSVVSWIIVGCCLVLAVWAVVLAVRNTSVTFNQLIGAAVIEVALVAQMVVAGISLAGGHDLGDPVTFWGYLITALVMMPVAAVVAFTERSRWSSVVLAVAAVVLMVMQMRVNQVWMTS
ncbi:hypothetical protein EXU48_21980 [Occultella glacieicola]|uniref:Integral membrane protein n=1 Tax=Occultella glacieicola TaxID=2518684 RepID=A0ABY2DZ25_9MICO|nr:hypothetical protein [Occultella glacieicola]TDE88980.1 hypothetical protein EXU48_21980 [Occultella glacieicola]